MDWETVVCDWMDSGEDTTTLPGRLRDAGFYVVREGQAARDRVWNLRKLDVPHPEGRFQGVYCLEFTDDDLEAARL